MDNRSSKEPEDHHDGRGVDQNPEWVLPGRFQWFFQDPRNGTVGSNLSGGQRQHDETEKDHHRTMTFQDEFRRFLRKYGVEYDERYVWD